MELLYDANRGINNVSHTYSLTRWPPRQDQPGAALAKQKTSLICIQYIPINCSHQCSGNTKSKREPRGRPSGRNANQQQQEEQENEFPRGKNCKNMNTNGSTGSKFPCAESARSQSYREFTAPQTANVQSAIKRQTSHKCIYKY